MEKLLKQETIEEVAERMYPINNTGSMFMANREELNNSLKQEGFIEGYNEAVKTHYTDEEVLVLLQKRDVYNFEANAKSLQEWETPKQWFNQNKKK